MSKFISNKILENNFKDLEFRINKTERIEKAYNYLKSLPHKHRKYENCNSIEHSLRIAFKMETESLVIVSLFHDVLEDFGLEKKENLKNFCTKEELTSIEILTKLEGESYEVYIEKVSKNYMANIVKKYDILDNFPTATLENKIKYKKALHKLSGVYN